MENVKEEELIDIEQELLREALRGESSRSLSGRNLRAILRILKGKYWKK
jgi:hypothetical protein